MQVKKGKEQFYNLTKHEQTFWNKEKDYFYSEMSLRRAVNSRGLLIRNEPCLLRQENKISEELASLKIRMDRYIWSD